MIEKVPFPETVKTEPAEPVDRTFNLICPSESRVIGTLTGRTGDYINVGTVIEMADFQRPAYSRSPAWCNNLKDGNRVVCPRCKSDLLLAFQDMGMEEALIQGVPLVLGEARIA